MFCLIHEVNHPNPTWLSEEFGLRSLSKRPFSCDLTKNIGCDTEGEFARVSTNENIPASAGVCGPAPNTYLTISPNEEQSLGGAVPKDLAISARCCPWQLLPLTKQWLKLPLLSAVACSWVWIKHLEDSAKGIVEGVIFACMSELLKSEFEASLCEMGCRNVMPVKWLGLSWAFLLKNQKMVNLDLKFSTISQC